MRLNSGQLLTNDNELVKILKNITFMEQVERKRGGELMSPLEVQGRILPTTIYHNTALYKPRFVIGLWWWHFVASRSDRFSGARIAQSFSSVFFRSHGLCLQFVSATQALVSAPVSWNCFY
jgi:hypothetical protein